MKDILIIANFCREISPNSNSRFVYLATKLAQNNNVEFLSSSFDHAKKCKRESVLYNWNFKVTLIDEPGYRKNISVKRFYSHNIFAKNVKAYLKKRSKPDVVYCAVPSLDVAKVVLKYCKENNIRFIVDIQDLWPEAFEMVFKVPVVSNLIFTPFRAQANYIYCNADYIVSVSKTYADRAIRVRKKQSDPVVAFLGNELARFDSYKSEKTLINKDDKEVFLGYVGTLGSSYDIKTVIDALSYIKDKPCCQKLKFVLVGDGLLRADFEAYAKEKKVSAEFLGAHSYSETIATLCCCDIAVNPIRKGSAGSIINKHGDYASAGIPVINSQESEEYRALVDEYKMGFNCECGNAVDMAGKLEILLCDEELRLQMGQNARKCASERFDRSVTYKKIIDLIEK